MEPQQAACNHHDLHGKYPRTFDHMELAPGTTDNGVRPAVKKPAPPPPHTRSWSQTPSAAHGCTRMNTPQGKRASTTPMDPSKPPTSILEILKFKPPAPGKGSRTPPPSMAAAPPPTFATIAAQSLSPNKSKFSPTKSGTATATLDFTTAVRKHQDDFISLLHFFADTATISASKIGWLRADNVALMTSATIHVQQAGGSHFSFERLNDIARAEKKVARQLFAKEALMTAAANMATGMSSITDADKFTTVSHRSVGSSSSHPKQRPQSCSPSPPR